MAASKGDNMTTEDHKILMAKLERGKGGGKQVPKLSRKEAIWLHNFLLIMRENIGDALCVGKKR